MGLRSPKSNQAMVTLVDDDRFCHLRLQLPRRDEADVASANEGDHGAVRRKYSGMSRPSSAVSGAASLAGFAIAAGGLFRRSASSHSAFASSAVLGIFGLMWPKPASIGL